VRLDIEQIVGALAAAVIGERRERRHRPRVAVRHGVARAFSRGDQLFRDFVEHGVVQKFDVRSDDLTDARGAPTSATRVRRA